MKLHEEAAKEVQNIMDKIANVIESDKTVTVELNKSDLILIHEALLNNNIMAEMILKKIAEEPDVKPSWNAINQMTTEDGITFAEIHADYESACDSVVMTLAEVLDKAIS